MRGPGAAALAVSRETYQRLEHFAELLAKWTTRINLISRRDREQIWPRHIVDSLQVYRAAPLTAHWADLGSGGGFPGLVAAIAAMAERRDTAFTLIESDRRKAVFLRTVARELDLAVSVIAERIEDAPPQGAGVVTARALTDLDGLLAYGARHVGAGGTMIFPKGKSWRKEVENAQARWNFRHRAITSETDPDGVLLIIEGVSRD